jgi:hypothetical protein
MARKKHDTSRYGVSLGRSRGLQIAGGAIVVFTLILLMLTFHGLAS